MYANTCRCSLYPSTMQGFLHVTMAESEAADIKDLSYETDSENIVKVTPVKTPPLSPVPALSAEECSVVEANLHSMYGSSPPALALMTKSMSTLRREGECLCPPLPSHRLPSSPSPRLLPSSLRPHLSPRPPGLPSPLPPSPLSTHSLIPHLTLPPPSRTHSPLLSVPLLTLESPLLSSSLPSSSALLPSPPHTLSSLTYPPLRPPPCSSIPPLPSPPSSLCSLPLLSSHSLLPPLSSLSFPSPHQTELAPYYLPPSPDPSLPSPDHPNL